MRRVSHKQHQKLLVQMLEYIDKIAQKNNIKYTLIGGSLIGAIREGGIIPWDDDVDISLMPGEYEKLLEALRNDNNDRYRVMTIHDEPTYFYPFAKLIDTKTILMSEGSNLKPIENYGIYLDIFRFIKLPDNIVLRRLYEQGYKIRLQLLHGCGVTKDKNIVLALRTKLSNIIGAKNIINSMEKYYSKYDDSNSKLCMSCWAYKNHKESEQILDYYSKYERVKFENITTMITSDYHAVLSHIFGDYMKRPPKSEQKYTHNCVAYYKDLNEKN